LFAIGSTTVSCIEKLNPSGLLTELYISLLVARPFIPETATMLLVD